jgi:hypothetical protein
MNRRGDDAPLQCQRDGDGAWPPPRRRPLLHNPGSQGPAAEKPYERQTRPERFLVVGLYQRQAQEHRIAGHSGGKHPASPEVTDGINGASRTG